MPTKVYVMSGKARKGTVNMPLAHPVSVVVTTTDAVGREVPMKNVQVRIFAEDPDSMEFDSGRGFELMRADDEGKVETRLTPLVGGVLKYTVSAEGIDVECTVNADDTGITRVPGATLVPTADGRVAIIDDARPHCVPPPRPKFFRVR
ncbi:MAG: hypothetical protein ABIG71_03800 [Candidatus Uhrbacteria bacterium]